MTGRVLATRDRRAVVIGGACVLAMAMLFRGVPTWRDWRMGVNAVAAEALSQAAAWDGLVDGFDTAMDTLESRIVRVRAAGPVMLSGETPAAAGSSLAALLAAFARESLVRLDAIDVRVDSARVGSLQRVTVQAQATADIAGLSALVAALERGPTLLAVRQLIVQGQSVDGSPDQVELLSLRFTVEGLALIRSPGDSL